LTKNCQPLIFYLTIKALCRVPSLKDSFKVLSQEQSPKRASMIWSCTWI